MHMNRFQQGDKVSYCGTQLAKELGGRLGVVHARVGNTENGVVVDFGDGSYIMDEERHLTRFQGKEVQPREETQTKADKVEKKVAGPEVVRRKGRKNPDNG